MRLRIRIAFQARTEKLACEPPPGGRLSPWSEHHSIDAPPNSCVDQDSEALRQASRLVPTTQNVPGNKQLIATNKATGFECALESGTARTPITCTQEKKS